MSLRKSAFLAILFVTACRPVLSLRADDPGRDKLSVKPALYQPQAANKLTPVQLIQYNSRYRGGGYRGGYGGYRSGYGYRGYRGGYFPYYSGYYGGGLYSPFGYGLGLGYGLGSTGYAYPGTYGGNYYSFPSYGGYGYTYGYTPSYSFW